MMKRTGLHALPELVWLLVSRVYRHEGPALAERSFSRRELLLPVPCRIAQIRSINLDMFMLHLGFFLGLRMAYDDRTRC